MKTSFVKSTDARLVESEKYGFSNRGGQLVIAASRASSFQYPLDFITMSAPRPEYNCGCLTAAYKGIDTDYFCRPVTGDRMPGPFADLGTETGTRSIDPR
jgi:hypothetical protein